MSFVALDVLREAEYLFTNDISVDVTGPSGDPGTIRVEVISSPAAGFGAVVPQRSLGPKERHREVLEIDGEFVSDEFIEGTFRSGDGVINPVGHLAERGFPGGFDTGVEVSDFPADPREFNHGCSVLGGALTVLDEFVESAFQFEGFGSGLFVCTDGSDDVPAVTDFAENVVVGGAGVVDVDLVEFAVVADLVDSFEFNGVLMHVDDERCDAFVFGAGEIGARE